VRAKDVLEILRDEFSPIDFPEERTCIQATIGEVKGILEKNTDSLAGRLIAKTRVPAGQSIRLTPKECMMAIAFFNDIDTLDLVELKILLPVL
jgi:hypothetical protein